MKAVIITYSNFQDQEVIYPYYRLVGENIDTKIVSDKKDEYNRTYGIFGVNVPCHILIEDFIPNVDDYDLLVLPGGVKSLEKLRQNHKIINFIREWNKSGKLIASICHGAQLLISANATSGRKISGYYSIKDDITNSGAVYVNEPVVIDENIVSCPHYDHMGIWMETVIKKLS